MKVLVDLGLISAIFIAAAVLNIIIIGALVCEISVKKDQVKFLKNENAGLRVESEKMKKQLSKWSLRYWPGGFINTNDKLEHIILNYAISKKKLADYGVIDDCNMVRSILPDWLYGDIVNELVGQMRQIINEHICCKDECYEDKVNYYCDVWVK